MMYVDFAVRFVIAMLLAGLWQAPLFGLAAWAVLRVNASANATTRHSVLAAALFASLILPVATATLAMQHADAIGMATNDSGDVKLPKGARSYVPVDRRPSLPKHTRVPSNTTTTPVLSAQASHSITIPSIARFNISLPRRLALAVVGMWLASAALVLTRLALSLIHLERLKRDAMPLDVGYRIGLTRWAVATKGSRNVRLCTTGDIDIPIAVGLFDAMILVPKRLLAELAPHDIDTIVLHELAHLRRCDDWINAVERVANALLFFNPGIIWLASQLDLEREVACDDWVLQQNDALPYATCLAKVAETAIWPHRPMTAPGAFVTRRGMSIRIERLLAKHRDVRVRTSFGLATAAVALLGVLGFVAAFVSPSIAYDTMQLPGSLADRERGHVRSDSRTNDVHEMHLARGQIVTGAHVSAPAVKPEPKALPRPVHMPSVPIARDRNAANTSAETVVSDGFGDTIASIDAAGHHIAVSASSRPERQHGNQRRYDDASGSSYSYASGYRSPTYTPDAGSSSSGDFDASDSNEPGPPAVPKPPAGSKTNQQLVADASDPDYIDELKSAGYTNLTIDQLIELKSVGVDADFIRSLEKYGLGHPPVEELTKLRAIGVHPAYVAEMRKRFGSSLGIEDIVSLRAVGVSKAYIDSLSLAGLSDLSAPNVRKLRALGVSPDYVRALKSAGHGGLSADEIASLRAVGVDPAFVNAMRKRFGDSLSLDDITGMGVIGVTAAYCDELSAAGLKELSADKVKSLRTLGVTPKYIGDLARAGYSNLPMDDIEQLRALGIDAEFIDRAERHGFHHSTVEQLINLKATGVL